MKDTHDIYGTAPSGPREEPEPLGIHTGINQHSVHRNWLLSGSFFVVTMVMLGVFLYFLDQRLESAGESTVMEVPEGDLLFLPALNSNTIESIQARVKAMEVVLDRGATNAGALSLTGVAIQDVDPSDFAANLTSVVTRADTEAPMLRDRNNVAFTMVKLAEELYEKGEYGEAGRSLRLALEREPGFIEARELLGAVLLAAGDEPAAIDVYGELISRNPYRASYYNNLALARMKLDQDKGAERNLLEALRLQSDYADAKVNLGLLYFRRRAFRDTLYYLGDDQVRVQHKGHPGVHYGLGVSNLELGNYAAARRSLQEVVRLLPKRADTYYYVARSYALENDGASALAWLTLGREHGDAAEFSRHTDHPAFAELRNTERFLRIAQER